MYVSPLVSSPPGRFAPWTFRPLYVSPPWLDELSASHCFLTAIQRRTLKYFGHVVIAENLSTDILHGRINGIVDLEAGRKDVGQIM